HRRTIDTSCPDRKLVFGVFLNADAAKALVRNTETFAVAGRLDAKVMGVWRVVHRTMIVDIELSFSIAAVQLFPTHHRIGKLERAVLNAFGIETAISAEVYILKEKAEQRFRYCGARLVDLHRDVSRLRENDLRLNERNRQQETKSF